MKLIGRDRYLGLFLGLALGDSLGAPFEGGIPERCVWALIGRTRGGRRRWTDDTQMSLDIAESIICCNGLDLDDIATRYAKSYRWTRGYGPGAAKTLKLIRRGVHWSTANTKAYPQGSFGNGGAMRAPVLALLPVSREERIEAARDTAEITHAHELGREGAAIICIATQGFLENIHPSQLLSDLATSIPPQSDFGSKFSLQLIFSAAMCAPQQWKLQGHLARR